MSGGTREELVKALASVNVQTRVRISRECGEDVRIKFEYNDDRSASTLVDIIEKCGEMDMMGSAIVETVGLRARCYKAWIAHSALHHCPVLQNQPASASSAAHVPMDRTADVSFPEEASSHQHHEGDEIASLKRELETARTEIRRLKDANAAVSEEARDAIRAARASMTAVSDTADDLQARLFCVQDDLRNVQAENQTLRAMLADVEKGAEELPCAASVTSACNKKLFLDRGFNTEGRVRAVFMKALTLHIADLPQIASEMGDESYRDLLIDGISNVSEFIRSCESRGVIPDLCDTLVKMYKMNARALDSVAKVRMAFSK